MTMGLGYMKGGGGGVYSNSSSSSSNSNLSPLAPPFTVDRQNPNPNPSNPRVQYSVTTYGTEPSTYRWNHYVSPSAPVTELPNDSTSALSVDDYHPYTVSMSQTPSTSHWSGPSPSPSPAAGAKYLGGGVYDYGTEVDPYYNPPLDNHDFLFGDDGSRYDLVHGTGLSLSSHAGDYSGGFLDIADYGRRYKDGSGSGNENLVELDANFLSWNVSDGGPPSFQNQSYQGGGSTYGDKSRLDSRVLYQQSSNVEANIGPFNVGQILDQTPFQKKLGFRPYESKGPHLAGCSSTHPASHPSVSSCEMPKDFSSYGNTFCLYEKYDKSVQSPSTGYVSVKRSSPAVVIRPPPAADGNLLQANVSREAAPKDDTAGSNRCNFDNSKSLRQKDSMLKLGCEKNEDSYEAKLVADQSFSSSSVEELSSHLHSKDSFDQTDAVLLGSEIPYIKASAGAYENIQVVIPAERSKDLMDYQNLAVDSPCWKGAPPNQYSPFDVEAGFLNSLKNNWDVNCGVHRKELENPPSSVNPARTPSEKAEESNKNVGNGVPENSAGSVLDRTCDDTDRSKIQNLLDDDIESVVKVSTEISKRGVQICDESNMIGRNTDLLNYLKSGFDIKTSSSEQFTGVNDAEVDLNDVSDAGAVAVHAAEKVLASPSSQENAELTNTSNPKLNVPGVIKAMCNLSELLLCHISCDAFYLDKESTETLRCTISNLTSCMSKKITEETNETQPGISLGGISGKPVSMVNLSGGHMTHEEKNIPVQLGYKYARDEKINYSPVSRQGEKSPIISPLMDDLEISEEDNMAKAIKRVLEENFHFDEEMQSQTHLFKNLWLEAEAKLCSISFKARFDRMKIQMEKLKANAQQEVEDSPQMMPQADLSPKDFNGVSKQSLKAAHDNTTENSSLVKFSTPSTSGYANDIETSVMARFNILKSRVENLETFNAEALHQPTIGGEHSGSSLALLSILKSQEESTESPGKHMQSVMSRLDILKSREDNLKPDHAKEKWQLKMIDDEHVSSIMAHYHILRSRDEDMKSNIMQEEKQGEMDDGRTSNKVVEPYFSCPTGNPSEGKSGSRVDCSGYESLMEYMTLRSDPMLNSFTKGSSINEGNFGWPDSYSSDWEHVMKDEVVCKKY